MTTNPISCSARSRKFIYVSLRIDGSQVTIDEAASSHYALKYDGILESCQHIRELQNDAHSIKYLIRGLNPSTDTTDGPLPFNSFAAHRQIKFENQIALVTWFCEILPDIGEYISVREERPWELWDQTQALDVLWSLPVSCDGLSSSGGKMVPTSQVKKVTT